MPTRSFPVGASSDRAAWEGVMARKIARARRAMPWQVETLNSRRIALLGRTRREGVVAFQTSQDKTTGSNSFAHVAFSGTVVSAEAFEKMAMTSPAIFAR